MADNWNRRDKGMLCSTCISYVPKLPPPNFGVAREVGRCRKHAPTHQGFPVVFPNDWCGDHRLDENKVQAEAPATSMFAGCEAQLPCDASWHINRTHRVGERCPSCGGEP